MCDSGDGDGFDDEPPTVVRYDVRYLVCEGAECNPQIREYDLLIERFEGGRGDISWIKDWARLLRHTLHERVGGMNWDPARGWIGTFRCGRCGHVRQF